MAKKCFDNSMGEVSENVTLAKKSENMSVGEGKKKEKVSEKKSKGRQKVGLVRMENESNRLVTFSKRRTGLFKKASELCTLCGIQIAIIVFSPSNKVYSFGHPCVDSIINRYLLPDHYYNQPIFNVEVHNDRKIKESNTRITFLNNKLEEEKKHKQTILDDGRKEDLQLLEELGIEDLKNLRDKLTELVDDIYQLFLFRHLEMEKGKVKAFTSTVNNLSPAPKEIIGEKNPISAHLSDNPKPTVENLVEGRNNYEHPQMIIPSPMNVFGDPSLKIRCSGISMNNARTSIPDSKILAFQPPNSCPPFQGETNSLGGSQVGGQPPFPPYNQQVQGMNPMLGNSKTFNLMLPGPS